MRALLDLLYQNICATISVMVTIRKTFKYRLYTNRRNKHLHRQIDIAGIIWNHSVALQRRYYRLTGGYINKYRLMAHLAKLRMRTEQYAYWQMVGSQAVQDIVDRLDRSYQAFFKYKRGETALKRGRPGFKKVKKYSSFTLKQAGWKYLGENRVRIGKVTYKFARSREIEGQVKTVTIKRDRVGRLYVCFSVVQEVEIPDIASTGRIGGFDFGLRTFLTDDEGEAYIMPQYLKENLKEIARLSRALSRKQPGSNNYEKAKRRLACAHARLANKRRDVHFKLARRLAGEYDILCFEDLNIKAMQRMWGRKVSDLGFSEFLKIQKHIAMQMGKIIVQIDRFEPSTTPCSACGRRKPMPLHVRVFECQNPECLSVFDRDHNAARNIKRVGASTLWLEGVRREPVPAALA
jgi:putative transposase